MLRPQEAEKQLLKVNVGGGGGCRGQQLLLFALAGDQEERSLSIKGENIPH